MATNGKTTVDKSNKYDRQLRLWGDHGQAALESARVCLINATATGSEILKNLILPGIGSFTIVDGHKVQSEDIGNNFFVTKESIGKSRAQVTTELLLELNEHVDGNFVEEHVDSLLLSNPGFFTKFSIVVATNLHERTLLQLGRLLWDRNIPLLICRCYGFIGYMRIVIKEHAVTETHPDSVHDDLRLDRPFKGLTTLCDTYNLDTMDKKAHSHTPWLVLIYKYLQQWKEQHNGEAPKNYREKNQLKDLIRQGVRKNEEGGNEMEENFDEAILHVNTALVGTSVPSDVKELFNDDSCKSLTCDSKPFWILLRAVKQFVENEGGGALPVRGTIPDMTADSKRYIELQQVYREQAAVDMSKVAGYVHSILQDLGINCNTITESDIQTFCKNSAFVKVVRCRSLDEEYTSQTANSQIIGNNLEDEDGSDLIYYVMLRAVDRFHEQYSCYPGSYDDNMETDMPKLKACVAKLVHVDWGLSSNVKDDYVQEMCRFGGSEIHSLAAFIGGSAAQEVIKLVTHQYVPFNNTFIYNAIKQTSLTEIL